MIKRILLSLLVVMPLLAKQNPQDAELMAKLNKLESLRQEIVEKESRIEQINKQATYLFHTLNGYDQEQINWICKEANKLEQYIAHAINNNINVDQAVIQPLCPELTIHRNELNRVQSMIVRLCVESFFLNALCQKYADLSAQIIKIQFEQAVN